MTGATLEVVNASHALWVPVPALKSKSNFRRELRGSAWGSIRSFEDDLAKLLLGARGFSWPLGDKSAKVSDRPHVVACVLARTLIDAGNLSKSVHDAAEGVIYHTDASVRCTMEFAERAGKNQHGAVGFAVCSSSDPAAAELLQTTYDLSSKVLSAWQQASLPA